MKTIAIIGASNNPDKFGNKAVRAYQKQGWTIYPINPKEVMIGGLRAYQSVLDAPLPIDRISLYVPSDVGLAIINDIAQVHPKEFFINPGAESDELIAQAKKLGLEPILACSIREIGEEPNSYE
ncbi:MAG: CoA-binding protein [Patescibacteria group bacterium]